MGFAAERGQCAGDDGKIVRGRGIGGGEFGVLQSRGGCAEEGVPPSVDESARGVEKRKGRLFVC